MSELVDDYEAFCDRLKAIGGAAVARELDDVPVVADLIECARAYLHDCDLDAAEDERPTSDEEPITDLIASALGLVRQALLAGNQDLLALAYAVLEKADRRLDRRAEQELDRARQPVEGNRPSASRR
jgi:hypothetical protein